MSFLVTSPIPFLLPYEARLPDSSRANTRPCLQGECLKRLVFVNYHRGTPHQFMLDSLRQRAGERLSESAVLLRATTLREDDTGET